jgi:hypothetical protein
MATWKSKGKFYFDSLMDSACRWLLKQYYKNHVQKTYCFCPGCGLELCRSDSWFSDTDLVRYKCIQCGAHSGWLFDVPVPILVEGKRESRKTNPEHVGARCVDAQTE